MTGYGRAVGTIEGMTVTVEIKSVNHKFFEFNAKIPRGYSFLEDKLKSFLRGYISRGKIDCFLQIENEETQDGTVSINESLAAGYYNAIKKLAEAYSLKMSDSVEILASHPDIFNVKKPPEDEDKIWSAVSEIAKQAVMNFISMRETEGEKLREDVFGRADEIISCVEFIEERSPQTVKEYNEKLKARIKELIGDASVDEAQRNAAEGLQAALTGNAALNERVRMRETTNVWGREWLPPP